MNNEEVICLSQMTAKEGKEKELFQALQALIPPTRQESGCLAYELWQDLNNPRSFMMYERFTSQGAFQKHIEMPYIQDFLENTFASCVEAHWDGDYYKRG